MISFDENQSDEIQRERVRSQIQPGAVFFIYDNKAQKNKFVIILGVDTKMISIGTLFINSEKNENVIRSLELHHLQFLIKAADYSFLSWDSYIGASNIIRRDYDEFAEIIYKYGGYQGEIDFKDFDYIRSIMAESDLISVANKRDFGLI